MIVVIRIALIPPPAPNWAKSCQFLVKEAFVRQFLHSSQFFLSIIRIVCANCFEAESTLVLILTLFACLENRSGSTHSS